MPDVSAEGAREQEALERVTRVLAERRAGCLTDLGLAAVILDALRWPRADGTVIADHCRCCPEDCDVVHGEPCGVCRG